MRGTAYLGSRLNRIRSAFARAWIAIHSQHRVESSLSITGIRVQAESGSVWRIRRLAGEPAGDRPAEPTVVPFYAGQYATWLIGLGAAAAGAAYLVRRLLRRSR